MWHWYAFQNLLNIPNAVRIFTLDKIHSVYFVYSACARFEFFPRIILDVVLDRWTHDDLHINAEVPWCITFRQDNGK